MADFTLEPDDIEPDTPTRSRPVHLVSGGLHPTEGVPASRRTGADPPPVYLPCTHCAQPVVIGEMADGTIVILDAKASTYALLWNPGTARPQVVWSRSYVAHRCEPPEGAAPEEDC